MKSIFRDVLKAGALFFAVGLALALVAPPLATLLGPAIIGEAALAHAVSTPVIWTGAFFGAFGAIDALLKPLANKLFGDKPAQESPKNEDEAKQVNITIVQTPQQSQEQVLVTANHRQNIEAERMELVMADKGATLS